MTEFQVGDRVVLTGEVIQISSLVLVRFDGDYDDTYVAPGALRHAEPNERAAPWPPPSGPREVWDVSSLTWPSRAWAAHAAGWHSSEAAALRAWHEARR